MTTISDHGFTILEIIIVLLIVAILATLAMPLYRKQVLQGHRSEGYSTLNAIMQAQERHAIDSGRYTLDLALLGYRNPQPTRSGFYQISASECSDATIEHCVLLVADAVGDQKQDNNGFGGTITLSSLGRKQGW